MRNKLNAITALIVIALSVISCEKKVGTIQKIDILTLPSLTAKDFTTTYTDSGKLQLELSAPLMESYDKAETPYSEFRFGINVLFHDGNKEPVASVIAKNPRYTHNSNLWELKDSVIVINESGDKLETEVLNWSEEKDLIYTDRFVKITNEDQVIHGFGFESDSHLNNRKIKKVQATIYFNDEE